ncbi:DMT family transporter [Streptomyces sp. NBC_01136]|uniref:DMT family transporter n=1 Tax=unclassified Streptomyces TaxID=2593676 RepID=UPI003247701C|nr:DMT family transporter [Streptomyces sp. NBC_01136]
MRRDKPVGLVFSVVFALLAAASNATATVLQRRAAQDVPLSEGFRARLLVDLLHRPVWLGGMAAVMAAACFQALALVDGALSVVQPIFVLELPFALLIGGLVLRRRVTRHGWTAVACIAAGLGMALAAAAPSAGTDRPTTGGWVLALACCIAAIVVAVRIALRRPAGRARAACFGAAAAIGYALTAALIKDATHAWQTSGATGFFLTWQTYAFAATGVCALFLLQNAVQSGPLVASQPALTLGDALVSLALGVTLYAEKVRTGWWLIPENAGAVLILYGAVLLARIPLAQALVAPDRSRA